MNIKERLITKNAFSRPGMLRTETRGIVIHWIGNAGTTADANARYFEILGKQDARDDKPDRYASAHAIVGLEGEIIKVIPWDEVAYHVGARVYTPEISKQWPLYTSNQNMGTPNWCTIGIELCHPDWSGQFNDETLRAARWLVWRLMKTFSLNTDDIYRHYDMSGKICPKWFVEHLDAWDQWLLEIQAMAQLEV